MSEFSKFLSDLLQKFGESVQLGMVGKIQSFNKQTMRAEVVPLLRKESPTGEVSQFPVLSSVPCAFLAAGNFFIRPVYQAGDLVWLTFATHSIFDSLRANPALASDQIFGIQNACVVNGLLQTGGSIGGAMDDADGMAIGDPDFFLEFTDSGVTAHLDGNTVDFDANGITVNDTKDVKFMPQNRSARTDGFLTPLGPTIQRLPGIHP